MYITPRQQNTCPNCGYCEHCGRGGSPWRFDRPPTTWPSPYWLQPNTIPMPYIGDPIPMGGGTTGPNYPGVTVSMRAD